MRSINSAGIVVMRDGIIAYYVETCLARDGSEAAELSTTRRINHNERVWLVEIQTTNE